MALPDIPTVNYENNYFFLVPFIAMLLVLIIVQSKFRSKRGDRIYIYEIRAPRGLLYTIGFLMKVPTPEDKEIKVRKKAFSRSEVYSLTIPYWSARHDITAFGRNNCSAIFGYRERKTINVMIKAETLKEIGDSGDILASTEKRTNEMINTALMKFRANAEARRQIQDQIDNMNRELVKTFRVMSQSTTDFSTLMRAVYNLVPDEINYDKAEEIIINQTVSDMKSEAKKQQIEERKNGKEETKRKRKIFRRKGKRR